MHKENYQNMMGLIRKIIQIVLPFLMLSCGSSAINSKGVLVATYTPNLGGQGAVMGRVVSNEIYKPIQGASVLIVEKQMVVETDDNGAYEFPSLPPSIYTILVSAKDFKDCKYEDLKISSNRVTILDFRLVEDPTKTMAQGSSRIVGTRRKDLNGHGALIGKVLWNKKMSPLPGANVLIVGTEFGAAADMNGCYEISRLPPGEYEVKVAFIGFKDMLHKDVTILSDRIVILDFQLSEDPNIVGCPIIKK